MLPASVKIFVCTAPQDMRRSFDKLALSVREILNEDPQSGALFVFVGKRPTRLKVLWWDKNGYCLLYKRLHRAHFRVVRAEGESGTRLQIDGAAFADLLVGAENEKSEKVLSGKLTPSLH
jgi:transposase